MNKGKGLNLKRVQALNRSLVLNILRQSGIASRADIARKSNLKQATITNITKELIQLGYVRETGYFPGQRGRRSVGLTIDENRYRTIAARLTRHHVTAGIFTILGTELNEERELISVSEGPEAALDRLSHVVSEMIEKAGRENVLGFGLALPGPFIRPESRIALVTGFPNWEKINLKDALEKRLNLPIALEHDTTTAALAEWWIGDAKNGKYRSMVNVVGGQGVGAGIVYNGEVILGTLGTAGEIGHHTISYDGPQCECGNRGCLELYCSTEAILNFYINELSKMEKESIVSNITFANVAERFLRRESIALEIVTRAAEYLAIGMVNMVNTLNPDLIVIGDELAALGDDFIEIVRNNMRERLIPELYQGVSVQRSAFGEEGCIRGMAMLIADQVFPTA